jgi:acetyl-CoA C-acetyltransferase
MSNAIFYSTDMRWGGARTGVRMHDQLTRARSTAGGYDYPVSGGMIETAENLRREYDISREEQDLLAYTSHQRAVRAIEEGRFETETVPVTVPATRKAPEQQVTRDEHPRPDVTPEKLAALRTIRGEMDPSATVTAGNASGQNDGGAACIVTTPEEAERLGLRPLARLVAWSVAGVEPKRMGIGPVPAVARLFDRTGLTMADMDLIELNEAFAAQVLACAQAWGFTAADHERFNVNGSGISLGHPVGATGARIVASTLHELARRDAERALVTLCIGGGQGIAAVVERVR